MNVVVSDSIVEFEEDELELGHDPNINQRDV